MTDLLSDARPDHGPTTAAELDAALGKACSILKGPVHRPRLKDWIIPLLLLKRISDSADAGGLPSLRPGRLWAGIAKAAPAEAGAAIAGAMAELERDGALKLDGIFSSFGEIPWADHEAMPPDRLSALVGLFSGLRLGPDDCPPDVIGAAYENLVKRFADLARNDGGEFYTPTPLAELMARLLDPGPDDSVYDPACGSGGLLAAVLTLQRRRGVRCGPLFGQEVNGPAAAMAKANLLLHGAEDFSVARGDTLRRPTFMGEGNLVRTFGRVAANPPYSLKNWGPEDFGRFPRTIWGTPPAGNADWAWLEHMAASMEPGSGRMAALMSQGVLFRGGREGKIRKAMLMSESPRLTLVAVLPKNLFHSTSMAPCLLMMSSERAPERPSIWMVDASRIYTPRKVRNELSPAQADEIFRLCSGDGTIPGVAGNVALSAIEADGWNLSVNRHLDAPPPDREPTGRVVARYLSTLATLQSEQDRLIGLLIEHGLTTGAELAANGIRRPDDDQA
jgi:type I restriction enzyme M protein